MASQPLDNRYVFNSAEALRRCYYRPEWNLDYIVRDMKLSSDLIEFLYLSENEQQRRIALQSLTHSSTQQSELFTNTTKVIR